MSGAVRIAGALLLAASICALPPGEARAAGGDAEILQSRQGDFPTARIDQLPEGQRGDLPSPEEEVRGHMRDRAGAVEAA